MGSSVSHFYFVRSVLHLVRHVRNVLAVRPALPQEVVSELVYQTHLDRDRIRSMFRIFISMTGQDCRLTPKLLSDNLPGWGTNPMKVYLREAIFKSGSATTFPELVKRVALFCPESKFSPAMSETEAGDAVFLDTAASKRERFQRQRLLMMFRLTDLNCKGLISQADLDRLIRCLLRTTIPHDTTTIIPEKIISDIARVVIISVHERNEALCWAVCRSRNRVAAAYEADDMQGSHRLVITKDMFLSELSREELI